MKARTGFILMLVIPAFVFAQDGDVCLQGRYDGLDFEIFADSVRAAEEVSLFFLPEWVSSVTVKQDLGDCSLRSLLSGTLTPAGLSFITDPSGNYIVTAEAELLTALPESFFRKQTVRSKVVYDDTDLQESGQDKVLQSGLVSSTVNIGNPANRVIGRKETFSGVVTESETGEPVIGAVIFAEDEEVGTVTDSRGYFVMTLPSGQHTVSIRCVGRENKTMMLNLYESGSTDISLQEEITALRGVIVVADKGKNVTGMQIGLNKVSIDLVKQIPAMMGEADVLKTAILLPGVQTVGEGASGFNVRGGSTDQNLILFNSSPIFNSSHFFGFFSAFNPDLVKEFELYKSGIPAEYGGRISSVFDITSKLGNTKKLAGSGGISPVTARLTLEGPTVKEKGSFLIGARSTYSDILLRQFDVPELRRSKAGFYDVNFLLSQKINDNNDVMLSLYTSNDNFQLSSDTSYAYRNLNGTLEWKHKFSDKLINETKAIFSHYGYQVTSDMNPVTANDLTYAIDYMEGRTDFRYFLSNAHTIKFGLSSVWYSLEPGNRIPIGEESLVVEKRLENEQANEISVYLSDEYNISQDFTVYAGLRYALYRYLGPQTVNHYLEGPREPYNFSHSTFIEKGTVQQYSGPEVRLSMRYRLDRVSSLKLSYNRMRQNLHMLSNTTAISPTDIWKLSDTHIKPQVGDQVALGYYRDFLSNTIETSVELYYKRLNDILDYKGGAQLIMNELIETDLVNGTGNAYGVEFLVKKKYGRLNGLLSYTYSRTLMQVIGEYPEESVNFGEVYPANYDKPHDLTGVISFRFNRRLSLSSNITYSTARPITYPVAKYTYLGSEYVHYSGRNEYRLPRDYFRLDLSLNLDGNLRSKKLAHSSWALSVFNLTGRNNVYSVYFTSAGGKIQGYILSIFTEPIPTITYSFKF